MSHLDKPGFNTKLVGFIYFDPDPQSQHLNTTHFCLFFDLVSNSSAEVYPIGFHPDFIFASKVV